MNEVDAGRDCATPVSVRNARASPAHKGEREGGREGGRVSIWREGAGI
jgi:hypothetical protein